MLALFQSCSLAGGSVRKQVGEKGREAREGEGGGRLRRTTTTPQIIKAKSSRSAQVRYSVI